MDLGIAGRMALVTAVLPGMRARGWGRVVNVSSSAVREPIAALMLSNSHRTGMLGAFKTLARQVAADGVTLNTVLPGRIATERAYDLSGGRLEAERWRSEEHTSELQSHHDLVCRLLLEKKKKT